MMKVEAVESSIVTKNLPDGWRGARLRELCMEDRNIVEPDSPTALERPYLSLEHIESNSGRIVLSPAEAVSTSGRSTTFAFDERHVLYGKLRPYLNKVALPDFPGRCTTELIPLLPKEGIDRAFLAWILRRKETVDTAMRESTGSRMPRADMDVLFALEIPVPPFAEQQRIVTVLNEQMTAVQRAKAATEAQLKAAKDLLSAYLHTVFDSPEAHGWPTIELGQISKLLPSKSISSGGDTQVLAITTACLTESGFQPSGVKVARMHQQDALQCHVSKGEVLIARSNTANLVGRVAMFSGEPEGAVASDLTIRIWPSQAILSPFLTAYLSFLFVSGYWRERAGGASGSMKKITRTQILDLQVPLPSLSDQKQVVTSFAERIENVVRVQKALEEQFSAIGALPASLLVCAFKGEL